MELRFKGFLETPLISGNEDIYGLNPFRLNNQKDYLLNDTSFVNQRLGKLVEQFTCFQLQLDPKIKLLASNIQIKNEKQTIGEIDALLQNEHKLIHLEIIYKFYLYDILNNYKEPLAYWIGPNRKDTLLYKLDKLKNKQLPLIHNKSTQPYLATYNIDKDKIEQQIYFKAQLFVPHNFSNIDIEPLNEECISGSYISYKEISIFNNQQFYIPKKLDWLVIPHENVNWLNFEDATKQIKEFIVKELTPLIWLKDEHNNLKKYFITWW